MNTDCIFCKIVAGTAPSHTVWESDSHMAFLSIFPNTPGVTVVIPRTHISSYVFDASPTDIDALVHAAQTVAHKIDNAFVDVGRTGMIFEGFGVDHLHAKLFPMHGTAHDTWRHHASPIDTFMPSYQGYLSSHDAHRASDAELGTIAEQIRNA